MVWKKPVLGPNNLVFIVGKNHLHHWRFACGASVDDNIASTLICPY
jgi:hypothetical protein